MTANPSYVPQTSTWANVNTYAPWDQFRQQTAYYSDPANTKHGTNALDNFDIAPWSGDSLKTFFTPWNADWGALWRGLSGKGHKRSSPEYYSPSYQGTSFTPAEGYSEYYQESPEVQQYNQMDSLQNSLSGASYDYNYGAEPTTGTPSPQFTQYNPYSYDSFNQNYVGQSPYGYEQIIGQNNPLTQTFKASMGLGSGVGQYGM